MTDTRQHCATIVLPAALLASGDTVVLEDKIISVGTVRHIGGAMVRVHFLAGRRFGTMEVPYAENMLLTF